MLFEADLTKLGLSDKEAAVYLAALALGAGPVQPIARRAQVARATTYLVLESLMKRGLVTQYEEGKKTVFVAEPPQQLAQLLEKQESVIQEKRQHLKKGG